jgi:hypothetical protein
MIRSNLPLPFLYRFKLQAGSAARRAQTSLVNYRQARDGQSPSHPRHAMQVAARHVAVGDADQLWQTFVDQYERFTDVLCAAAKNGCDMNKESEYAQLRQWFVANYYRLSARIRPYLQQEFASDLIRSEPPPTVMDYAGQKRTLDVLEALFLPPTLRDVLRHDTGNLIPYIARISSVVYRCHDEWQQEQSSASR